MTRSKEADQKPDVLTESSDGQEVEWQFDALDTRPVARWLDAGEFGSDVEVSGTGEKNLRDAYLDTADWRVYRAGYALRVREKGNGTREATMKLLASSTAEGPKTRREISEPIPSEGDSDLPASDGPVGERVSSLAGTKGVERLFEVRTKRKTYRVSIAPIPTPEEDAEQAPGTVAEVALDETEIPLPSGDPVALRRVEVEIEEGSPGDVEGFVEEMRQRFRMGYATTSKFEAGLLALDLTPPVAQEYGPTDVSPEMTAGELAFAVLRQQFTVFLSHEPGTRIGEDPEELHDMRVASRRMRAAMKVFVAALPVRSARLEGELKWVAAVLGEVRDLDVQLEQLEDWIGEAPEGDRQPLAELRGVLGTHRAKARKAMLRALDSRRFVRFVESYSGFLRRGPAKTSAGANRPALEVGPELVGRAYRKVRKAGNDISASSRPEDYHDLRKRGKRLRYTLEFFSDLYGKPARELTIALKKLQDVLGDHQDAEVAVSHLETLALTGKRGKGGLSPHAVFVMGGIAERYRTRAAGLRGEFPAPYGDIKGARWKRLRKAMDKSRKKSI